MSDGFMLGFRVVAPVKEPSEEEKKKFWNADDPRPPVTAIATATCASGSSRPNSCQLIPSHTGDNMSNAESTRPTF